MPTLYIILAGAYAWLCFKDIRWALYTLCAVLPSYLLRFSVFGVPGTMLEIFIWILFLVWFFRDRKKGIWMRVPMRVTITILLLAGVQGIFVAPDTFAALGIFKAYILEPLFVFLVAISILRREDLTRLFIALGASTLVISLFAVVQKFTGIGIPEPWDTARRVVGVFDYPNALGLFLAPILTAILVFVLVPKLHDREVSVPFIFLLFVALLGGAAIVFSKTEAAWIAIPVSVALTTLLGTNTSRSKTIGIVVGVIVAGLTLAFNPHAEPFRDKILLRDWSGQVRRSQWSETWEMLTDTPRHFFFGAGLSGYPTALATYHKDTRFEIFQYPHNIFLNVWTELGMIGLISLLWFIGAIIQFFKNNKRDPFVLAASAALLTMFIHGLVDVPYLKNDLAVLTWIVISIILIADRTLSPESADVGEQCRH